jgi:hypothetical protein
MGCVLLARSTFDCSEVHDISPWSIFAGGVATPKVVKKEGPNVSTANEINGQINRGYPKSWEFEFISLWLPLPTGCSCSFERTNVDK